MRFKLVLAWETRQSHTIPLAFPPIYGWTLGFFLTVCCEERDRWRLVKWMKVPWITVMWHVDLCALLHRWASVALMGSTCKHKIKDVCCFLSFHSIRSGFNSTLLLCWRGVSHRHDTVKGQINRWESRKWKQQGVPLPANNLAIHSSL